MWSNSHTIILSALIALALSKQKFKKQPSDVSAHLGDTKILECKVEDLEGDVQWTKDGFGLDVTRNLTGFPRYRMIGTNREGEYSLEINNINIQDDATYECQIGATNTSEALRSKPAKLKVLVPPDPPKILNGEMLNTTERTELSIECFSTGGRPKVKIRWMKADNSTIKKSNVTETKQKLPDGKRMTVSSVIRFNVTKKDDNTSVVCQTNNEALDQPLRTSIWLMVKYAPTVKITTDPSTIVEGDKVTFTCSASSNPAVKSYLWFKDNVPLIGSQTETYAIEKAGREHHNIKIKCQVRNLEGKVGSKMIKPKINYSPVLKVTPKDVSDDKGKKVTLPCVADGYPAPSYIWYRNGDINTVVGVKNNLSVVVSEENVGKYFCRISVKGFNEITTFANVYMKGPPRIKNKASEAVQIGKRGESGKVVCDSFAIPPPSKVTWSVNGKQVDGDSAKYNVDQTTKHDGVTSRITVLNPLHADYTEYKCIIENSYGNDTAVFTLKREAAASILLPVVVSIILISVLLMSTSLTVLYCLRLRREGEGGSEDTESTSDLGSEMSEASGYTIDSTESQTMSEPFSSTMSRSGMSSEVFQPRKLAPVQPYRGMISPPPADPRSYLASPPFPTPPPPIAPPRPPPRRSISPLPMSRARLQTNPGIPNFYPTVRRNNIIPSDELATMV